MILRTSPSPVYPSSSQSREDRQRLGDAIEDGALSAFPIQPLSVGSHGATRVSLHPTGDPNTTEVTVRHAFTARFAEGQNFANEGGRHGSVGAGVWECRVGVASRANACDGASC